MNTKPVRVSIVNGPDIRAANSFDAPDVVATRETTLDARGRSLMYAFEPHSVTALACAV
ncbi:MAG TPA: hypothetical protein VKY59_17205 [Spirillospora sp.]|nr:hypothetical protein [Spirillospora sp.]